MSNCPICSNLILRHISHNQIYWYCSHCHQEMPNFTTIELSRSLQEKLKQKELDPTAIEVLKR